MNLLQNPEAMRSAGPGMSSLGVFNDRDALATIVAYKFDLTGPAVTVQTFCSTSLVAVHLGCQSLLNGESDMALAGASSINVGLKGGYLFQEGGIFSPDGHCRTFDAKAAGTVFGNGVGLVVLKRLADALADGDTVHAVIRGSAINNDGAQKAGYTAPSVGGTNAHVILEEAPPAAPSGPTRSAQLLVLSAKTQAALDAATLHLVQHLRTQAGQSLGDVAYTLLGGRRRFEHRRVVVAET